MMGERIDLRKYLPPFPEPSAWYTMQPIWLDLNTSPIWMCDDREIAAAHRALEERGYVVTTKREDGGWLVSWTKGA